MENQQDPPEHPASARPAVTHPVPRRWPARLAVLAGLLHLTWCAGWTLDRTTAPLGVPLLAMQAFAVAELALLVRALRAGATEHVIDLTADPGAATRSLRVVVTAHGHDPVAVERTLTSLAGHDLDDVVVVDDQRREPVVRHCRRLGAHHVLDTRPAPAAFWTTVADRPMGLALWLDAGDVVMPDAIDVLVAHQQRTGAAVVQAAVGHLNPDSLIHLREGRDEESFEREVLAPALGARRLAPWHGAGSLCDVAALHRVRGIASEPTGMHQAAARLAAREGGITFEPSVQIRRKAPEALDVYLADRSARARMRAQALIGRGGLLRPGSAPDRPAAGARLAACALAATHLTGLRHLVQTLILVAVLLSGRFPATVAPAVFGAAWVVAVAAGALGRRALAGDTMSIGDWSRHGWRTLGADLRGLAGPSPDRRAPIAPAAGRDPDGGEIDPRIRGARALGRLRLLTAVVLVLDTALVLRGLTIVRPGLLPAFTTEARIVVLGAAIVVLVPIVDVLQVVVRRRQRRADHRIQSHTAALIDGAPCQTLDLSPGGVGVVVAEPIDVGSTVEVVLALPRRDGTLAHVQSTGVVRHVRPDGARYRAGIELGALDDEARAALFTYVAIDHPAGIDRVIDPEPLHSPAELPVPDGVLRTLSGPLSSLAGVAGALTILLGPAAANAYAESLVTVSVCVTDSNGAPLGDVIVEHHVSGSWAAAGTTDPSGCVKVETVGQGVSMRAIHQGRPLTRWVDIDDGARIDFTTTRTSVVATDSTGRALEGARVEYHAGEWRRAGTVGPDGAVTFEAMAGRLPVRVFHEDRSLQRTISVADAPRTTRETMATAPVDVQVTDASGDPLVGARVEYHSGGWRNAGRVGDDGTVRIETLPGQVAFRVWHQGRAAQRTVFVDADGARVRFATAPIVVLVTDSAGNPITGTPVDLYLGQWSPVGTTDRAGIVVAEALPGDISVRVTHGGRTLQHTVTISDDPEVITTETFTTTRIEVSALDSEGRPIPDQRVEYYTGEWVRAGFTASPGTRIDDGAVAIEALPGALSVRVWSDGRVLQQIVIVGADGDVTEAVFRTSPVEIRAVDSVGAPIEGARVEYHSGEWRTAGFTDATGVVRTEALPGNIAYRVWHQGRSLQKTVLVTDGDRGHVTTETFATAPLTVSMTDSRGRPLAGATVEYYSQRWRTADRTAPDGVTHIEAFPGTIAVKVWHEGRSLQRNVVVAGGVGATEVISLAAVDVRAQDSTGADLVGATVEYHTDRWRRAGAPADGVTTVEVLPGTVPFRLTVDGRTHQESVGVSSVRGRITEHTFRTEHIAVDVRTPDGAPLPGAIVSYYGGQWRHAGVVGEAGSVDIELLPGNVSLRVDHLGHRVTRVATVAAGARIAVQANTFAPAIEASLDQIHLVNWVDYVPATPLLPGTYSVVFDDASRGTVVLDTPALPEPTPAPTATPIATPTVEPLPVEPSPTVPVEPTPTAAPPPLIPAGDPIVESASADPTPTGPTPSEQAPPTPTTSVGPGPSTATDPGAATDPVAPTATTTPEPTMPPPSLSSGNAVGTGDRETAAAGAEDAPTPRLVFVRVRSAAYSRGTGTLRLEVTNQSRSRVRGPVVVDLALDPLFEPQAIDQGEWTCGRTGSGMQCISPGSLDAGSTSELVVPVRTDPSLPAADIKAAAAATRSTVTAGQASTAGEDPRLTGSGGASADATLDPVAAPDTTWPDELATGVAHDLVVDRTSTGRSDVVLVLAIGAALLGTVGAATRYGPTRRRR